MAYILKNDNFNPELIMNSGQCFRMTKISDFYEVIAFGKRLTIKCLSANEFLFDCSKNEYFEIWQEYFDLNNDYNNILCNIPNDDSFLRECSISLKGLRILKQEKWETLCSFIISQRKNIKAISSSIEKICDKYGQSIQNTSRKSFPGPEKLAGLTTEELLSCGIGYRAPYILDAARKVLHGEVDLLKLSGENDEILYDSLLKIKGVGTKVANCVMLFAYHRLSRAPIDVWIKRVIDEEYNGVSPFEKYGNNAGVYQQYMFMYKKDEKRRMQ